ncbi:hypothetical protein XENOCAPTIV_011215 [Xenoophorus captivus]|uniref:Uncharacterized protein n=1 Tax=Xenoophorus captivus TaxID=1517983 RepID=A0ABV0S8Q8_9TELE
MIKHLRIHGVEVTDSPVFNALRGLPLLPLPSAPTHCPADSVVLYIQFKCLFKALVSVQTVTCQHIINSYESFKRNMFGYIHSFSHLLYRFLHSGSRGSWCLSPAV